MEQKDFEAMIWEIHSQKPITVNVNQKSVGEVQFSCGCSDPNAHGNEDYPMVLYTTRFYPPDILESGVLVIQYSQVQ